MLGADLAEAGGAGGKNALGGGREFAPPSGGAARSRTSRSS